MGERTDGGYQRRNRRARLDEVVYGYSGHPVHLTLCTYRGRRVFEEDPALGHSVVELLRETAASKGVRLLGYCLMPDHLHVVAAVEPQGTNLKEFTWLFKTKSTWRAKRAEKAPLWQGGFYDHVVRRREDLGEVCRYVVENPVRRQLAARWEDYPWAWMSDEV